MHFPSKPAGENRSVQCVRKRDPHRSVNLMESCWGRCRAMSAFNERCDLIKAAMVLNVNTAKVLEVCVADNSVGVSALEASLNPLPWHGTVLLGELFHLSCRFKFLTIHGS